MLHCEHAMMNFQCCLFRYWILNKYFQMIFSRSFKYNIADDTQLHLLLDHWSSVEGSVLLWCSFQFCLAIIMLSFLCFFLIVVMMPYYEYQVPGTRFSFQKHFKDFASSWGDARIDCPVKETVTGLERSKTDERCCTGVASTWYQVIPSRCYW